ncbi:actinia tenebrosa protease inhibitors [Astyanax mexicanus]|uniref:actinia tenebrosa protease inhibitors n=1 Tax=Astyanax mexicanus TaxID=7994 RepID=UPI0020CB3AE3|nr:actinia tenebrosa protease inhibitors [Astyanax mexicanus]
MNSLLYFHVFVLAVVCGVGLALDPKCNVTAAEGTGDRTLKYSYNKQFGYCLPFFHKGECLGGNCFDSDETCMQSCSLDYRQRFPEGDAVCSLPPEKGNCLALLAHYYYDSEEKICRLFHYSGCHGNGNRFETREACQSMCQAKSGRMLGAAETPNPDQQTVDVGLIVGILGGIVFAVAVVVAIAMFVTQRKAKRVDMKKVPTTDIEMS